MFRVDLRGIGKWFVFTGSILIIGACSEDPSVEIIFPDNTFEAEIDSELEKLIPLAAFNYLTEDFSGVESTDDQYTSSGIIFNNSQDGSIELVSSDIISDYSPASRETRGSIEHIRIETTSQIGFVNPKTLLGLHISLDQNQAKLLEELKPESGDDIFLLIPQFRVLISGLDQSGEVLNTIRAIPATATFAETRVEKDWYWINTALLGKVHGLEISIESPVEGTESILLDNLTLSDDFEQSDAFFSIALIPDTQKYSEFPQLNQIFDSQTKYLAASKESEKIVFVSHLGDLVENGDMELEWMVADNAMSNLDGVLPYGVVIGNHDFQDEWNNPKLGSPLFNKYFPESRFSEYPWWGGFSPDGLSSYQIFNTDLGPFLYLNLTVDSPPPTVSWAQSILDANPGKPTLVTTHAYLRENGRIPVPYLTGLGGAEGWDGISADELFETLVAPNDQIFMVTCGHISAEHKQVSTNDSGKDVYELLQDYQNRESGGEGFLRLLRFYPDQNRIQAITYSSWLKTYEMDEDSYFEIEIDFGGRFIFSR